MEEIKQKIHLELYKECPDWQELESLLDQLGDRINDLDGEDTILTEVLESCWRYDSIERMTRLVDLILQHGYDPKANNGLNGALGLHWLCWSSYNNGIIEVAKKLLDAGADPTLDPFPEDRFTELTGILETIEWKLAGAWREPPFDIANLFEAYYDLARNAIQGEDYHSVFCYDVCLNRTLTAVSSVKRIFPEDQTTDPSPDYFVLWFDHKLPMVFNRKMNCVVNPVKIRRGGCESSDLCNEFGNIIQSELREVNYVDSFTAVLMFSNGQKLLITNNRGTLFGNEKPTIQYRFIEDDMEHPQ